MRSIRLAAVVSLAVLALVSCNRDPNVAKQRYLESGNKYYAKGLYKQARIKYMNALQKDMRFGPAYYGKGLVELKLGAPVPAYMAFKRAIELIKDDQPEHWDAMVKTTEILLLAPRDNKELVAEAKGYCDLLVNHPATVYDGHRLLGDWNYLGIAAALNKEDAVKMLDESIKEYRTANSLKPGQAGVELQLARAISFKNDLAGAEQLYRQVIAQDKTLQVAYVELYKLFLFQRRYDDGEKVLKDAFQNNPKRFDYLAALAMHYSLQHRSAEMLNVLQQIKSHAAEYPEAYQVVADFYLRLGDGDTAIKEFKEGQAKDPAKKLVYEKRIIEVLMRQGKRSEAADRTAAILKADPNDNDAKGLTASFLLDKGEINKAVNDLQAVVTRDPNNVVARFDLGRAHAAQGQVELAKQMFQKVIEQKPDFVPARLALAGLLVSNKEYDSGFKAAAAVLAIDRSNYKAMLIESAATIGQQKYGEARVLLDSIAKINANLPDVYFQLGVLDLIERKYKDADEHFRKTYQLNPADRRGLLGIVETQIAQNKMEDALKLLQSESEKAPTRLDFREALADTAVRAGKFDMGIEEYQKIINGMDKNARGRGNIYFKIGEVYRRKGDDVSAIAALQKARETLPEDDTVITTLGLTFDHAGHTAEARQIYETAIKLNSNNGVALNNLAFLLAEHNGDLDDALTKGTRAKQLMPKLAEVSDTLGWIYLKKNLSDDAVKIFQELVTDHPNQCTYRYHLAMALKQKGNKPQAIKECQEALRNGPTKDEKEKIQELLTRLNGA
jgi:tetratricopeptide (TPR) repeat protein